MDTSETYIKMCDCEEIQKLWEPTEWDHLFCRVEHEGSPIVVLSGYPTDSGIYGHGIEVGDECPHSSYGWRAGTTREYYETVDRWLRFKEDHIWLPHQDQLQEMVFGIGEYGARQLVKTLWNACSEHGSLVPREELGIPPIGTVDKRWSMEQLWLAFVMKEKYNKVWDGEQWQTH